MRKIYLVLLSCFAISGLAQQDLQFTQFQYNKLFFNPGVAGSGGAICVTAVHRSQWVGFDGAPSSQNITVNAPIKLLHGGLSLKITSDQIGYFGHINAGLGYAFQYEIFGGTLGAGFSANFKTQSVNNAEWLAPDNTTGSTDPSIADNGSTGSAFDMDFGIYFENSDLWAGISSSNLLGATTQFSGVSAKIANYVDQRHYYVGAGYIYPLQNSNLELRPSLLLKTDLVSSPVVDVNLTAVYNNKLWGGVSYRLTDAVAVNIGYQFTQALRAGYSYDIGINEISQQGGGSHEIFLSYCFKIVIPPKEPAQYKNVRFL